MPGTTAEVIPIQKAVSRRPAGGDAPMAPEINTVNSEPAPTKPKPPA